jgi:hypothetical protein
MVAADPPEMRTPLVVELRGPLAPAQVSRLCARVQALLLADRGRGLVCELRGPPDLGVVDALARLQVMARRLDVRLRVRPTSDGFRALLGLTGLEHAVPERLEPGGQVEAGEQRGVQEVVDVRDPSV